MNFRQQIVRHLINIPGWHTNRKIVVIESDDWGSIRMPSKEVYDYLLKNGYRVNERLYERYDALASREDLEALFEVLERVKDKNNKPAIITANSVVANPDFDKIRKSGFQAYHYELFYETLSKYNHHAGAFDLWKEGLKEGLFMPQFHGREHFNIPKWMHALQNGDKDAHAVFDLGMAGIFPKENPHEGNQYMNAYAMTTHEDLIFYQKSIAEGLALFENIWGFKSKSFIAPCYRWSKDMEAVLADKRIELIQGINFQMEPRMGCADRKIFHYSGEKNRFGQRYNVRNCFFEPALNPVFDWVNSCLNQIKIAFGWNKPAIIGSHRVNYIGTVDRSNRDRNLQHLKNLLVSIQKKWPDIEFVSSDRLIEVMT